MIRKPRDCSRAQSSHLNVPAPAGLSYLPYQKAGIEFIQSHDRILLADEPGLGKTVQAIGAANLEQPQTILIVAPASVKINWDREFRKWGLDFPNVGYISGRTPVELPAVTIMNYEILAAHSEALRARTWDWLVLDEAHLVKSGKADRTAQVFGRKRATETKSKVKPLSYKKLLVLTGTPILNKPKDLWTLLQVLDPSGLGSDWFAYAKRYCKLWEIARRLPNGAKQHIGWKWDGADHLEELQALMRERFMIRRLKADVLKELPPKTRQIIVLEAKKGLTKLLKSEILAYEAWKQSGGRDDENPPAFSSISNNRKEVAIAKIPYVLEYLEEVLNENEKVVCWAHHHEVLDAIAAHFGPIAVRLDGRTNTIDRQNAVDFFQTSGSNARLFVGGIQAAGVGITLTAAHLAVFAEFDWVPANNTQAEDRLHRIGQRDNVLIRYIALRDSLDERILQTLFQKQEIAEKTLDKEN